MAIITTGNSFNPTDTVTSAELNNIANAATFDDPVDGTSLELKLDGKLGVKDAGVTPAKLSTGAPSWNASGAFLTSNVTAPESANSLLLRSDPETPGTGLDGGSQIRLFSSDSDFPDQVYYRRDFHNFSNIAGDIQGSIPYDGIPTLAQHFTRKDYVDGTSSFTTEDGQSAGYQIFPSGLKMAWGDSTAALDGTITFPAGVGFTVAPTIQISYNKATTADVYYGSQVGDVTTTNFAYGGSYSNLYGPRYLAIGI